MSKLLTLLAVSAIALTGCSTGSNHKPVESSPASSTEATVKYDYDDDGYIDFVVKTHNGCVTAVELFDINGESTGYKLEQPTTAPCMSEAKGIDTLMAFIDSTGGL